MLIRDTITLTWPLIPVSPPGKFDGGHLAPGLQRGLLQSFQDLVANLE